MTRTVTAELLTIGAELLDGSVVNGNAAWLSEQLHAHGIAVTRHTVVADEVGAIAGAVGEALARVPVLLCTGGLGPTQDDLTREGLAAVAGVELQREETLVALIRGRYGPLGEMPVLNLRQADLPVGATSLPNPFGTAPGVLLEHAGGVVYALPGVPREMQAMVEQTVLPDLAERWPRRPAIVQRVLRTAGVAESSVAARLAPVVGAAEAAGVQVGFLAASGETRVKLTVTRATTEQAVAALEPFVAAARRELGEDLYAEGETTLASAVVHALRERGESLAVAESLTGGLVAGRVTDVPGASQVFLGGATTYATGAKHAVLGVPSEVLASHGAVSEATVAAMAEGARRLLGATWGLATSGVAGPDPQEGHPPGTLWLGLAGGGETTTRLVQLPDGGRPWLRDIAVVLALDLLRRRLMASAWSGPLS